MAKNKTAVEYINDNDFEGAKEKFDTARGRWKKHWFDTCFQIAQTVKEWASKYIFDPLTLTITKIEMFVKKVVSQKEGEAYVYLIKMYDDNGQYTYLKAGKADNINRRMRELSNNLYRRENVQIANVDILQTWTLPSSHMAEAFEQVVHHYLSGLFRHIPNDRYEPVELDENHLAAINHKYELMSALF